MKIKFIVLLILLSSALLGQSPAVFINEFLASNQSVNPDIVDFGDFSDWIELYNDENSAVDIGGFYITDDLFLPAKWQLASNTIIPAKGYLLIWADDFNDVPGRNYIRDWWPDNIAFTTQWNHTNFKLNKDGDAIALFNGSLELIDSVSYGGQETDVSYGRQPDGSINWRFFGEPTPSAPNSTAAFNGLVPFSVEVDFSHAGGFYQNTLFVELSSSGGAGTIYYTLDGSQPGSTSNIYGAPVQISANTVLRARLIENAKFPGPIITRTYIIENNRNLAAFAIATEPAWLMGSRTGIYSNTIKDREIPVNMEFFPFDESEQSFNQGVGMRIGGENIYRFAQKPLNIYARSKFGDSHIANKIFTDLPYQDYKRLYLRNSGDDWPNTMLKDGMLVSILKNQISNSMQNYRPSVLYLNGNYWGIYNLREKIDEQYFLQHYNVDPLNLDHLEANNKVITGDSADFVHVLDYAAANDLSQQQHYSYIKSKIDIHNLMDFIIVQDYLVNTSWGHNREVWRNRVNGLWRWILVDMDRGFYSSRISNNLINDLNSNFGLFRELCDNQDFVNELVQRYSYHVEYTFNAARVISIIDSLTARIEPEMPRHIDKWGVLIDSLSISSGGLTGGAGVTSLSSWNNQIQALRDFAEQRSNYAIQHLSDHFGLNGRSPLTIISDENNDGRVSIDGKLFAFGNDHILFNEVPVTIKAYPPPGYAFLQWKELISSETVSLINTHALWKYYDLGQEPSALWYGAAYDDSGWSSGNAILGYGDDDISTPISYGANINDKYITSYFRRTFEIDDVANIELLTVKLMRDDGAVVYINGTEVLRSNLPAGDIGYSTAAAARVSGADETTYYEFTVDKSLLNNGSNSIAVEIHQVNGTSSDKRFDLSLTAALSASSQSETVISSSDSIEYSFSGITRLTAEFLPLSSSIVPQNIQADMLLSRNNSPYYITEDITVAASADLTIEAGVDVFLAPAKSITVFGQLHINGTPADPVALNAYYPDEKWSAIKFANSAGPSSLNNVLISNATGQTATDTFFAAVSSLNSSVTLDGVYFNNCTLPVSSQWSDMQIINCTFKNITLIGDYVNVNGGNLLIANSTFFGNEIADMDAIDIGFMNGTTIIENNTIRDFTGDNTDGIDIGDASHNVIIRNNIITNCRDKGISIGQGSQALISYNSISACNLGIGIKDSLSSGEIINNTFYANNIAVSCFEKVLNRGGGTAHIKNSIFDSSNQYSVLADNFSEVLVNYSISNTDTVPGIGNVFAEPLLVNPEGQNFNLTVHSPARDSGDPASINDVDGSRTDMGKIPFMGLAAPSVIINEINYNSGIAFDSGDWIELFNRTYEAVDISGWVFRDETATPCFVVREGITLTARSYIVFYRDAALFNAIYPNISNSFGPLNSGLNGSGEAIALYDANGYLIDSLTYNNTNPWPSEASGNGHSLELVDAELDNGNASNWAASISSGTPGRFNSVGIVNIDDDTVQLPTRFALKQNYPNPFNPSTKIEFSIPQSSRVSLIVYDINGRAVKTILKDYLDPGYYEQIWDGKNEQGRQVTSGMYFIHLQAADYRGIVKALLIK